MYWHEEKKITTRYFEAECDDEGQVIDERIYEIYPPYGISFAVGVLVGVVGAVLWL